MMKNKIYGWLPDIPDQRDFLYKAIRPVIRLPRNIEFLDKIADFKRS